MCQTVHSAEKKQGVERTATPAALPSANQAVEAAQSTLSSALNVLLPAVAPAKAVEGTPPAPSNPTPAAGEPKAPQTKSLFDAAGDALSWCCEKGSCALKWGGEKLSKLAKVDSLEGFASWCSECVTEAVSGITKTIREATSGIAQFVSSSFSPSTKSSTPITDALEISAAIFKQREDDKKKRIEFFRELRRKRNDAEHARGEDPMKPPSVTDCAPGSVDPGSVADVKLAVLLNHYDSNAVVEIRRFLNQLEKDQRQPKSVES